MQQVYTAPQLTAQVAALQQVFDRVELVDPAAAALLDPATLDPLPGCPQPVPALDSQGRGWYPLNDPDSEQVTMCFYQAVQVAGHPFVLACSYALPQVVPEDGREANAFRRMLRQYREDLRRDYVTGTFNHRYVEEEYRPLAARRAAAGEPASVALVRVEEYEALCSQEGPAAADRCLNTAAGILRGALSPDWPDAALARLEDGLFFVGAGVEAAALQGALEQAARQGRRQFSISLSRRGSFQLAVAAADWAEAGSWDQLLALASRRLEEA